MQNQADDPNSPFFGGIIHPCKIPEVLHDHQDSLNMKESIYVHLLDKHGYGENAFTKSMLTIPGADHVTVISYLHNIHDGEHQHEFKRRVFLDTQPEFAT